MRFGSAAEQRVAAMAIRGERVFVREGELRPAQAVQRGAGEPGGVGRHHLAGLQQGDVVAVQRRRRRFPLGRPRAGQHGMRHPPRPVRPGIAGWRPAAAWRPDHCWNTSAATDAPETPAGGRVGQVSKQLTHSV